MLIIVCCKDYAQLSDFEVKFFFINSSFDTEVALILIRREIIYFYVLYILKSIETDSSGYYDQKVANCTLVKEGTTLIFEILEKSEYFC